MSVPLSVCWLRFLCVFVCSCLSLIACLFVFACCFCVVCVLFCVCFFLSLCFACVCCLCVVVCFLVDAVPLNRAEVDLMENVLTLYVEKKRRKEQTNKETHKKTRNTK